MWQLGKEMQFFPQEDAVVAVHYTPQNAIISVAGKSARLDVPAAVRAIQADAQGLTSLAVVPNGTHVLTGGAEKVAKMWNLTNGQMERSFAGATDVVKAIAV